MSPIGSPRALRCCGWSWGATLRGNGSGICMRGQWRKAWRRLRPGGSEWRGMTISYPTPAQMRSLLLPYFAVTRLAPLGVALPPSYAAAWLDRSPFAADSIDAPGKVGPTVEHARLLVGPLHRRGCSPAAIMSAARTTSTLEAYERWAPVYPPVAHNPLMRAEQRSMLEVWPDVEGRRVLDLACGSGRYSHAVTRGECRPGCRSGFLPRPCSSKSPVPAESARA